MEERARLVQAHRSIVQHSRAQQADGFMSAAGFACQPQAMPCKFSLVGYVNAGLHWLSFTVAAARGTSRSYGR